MNIENLKTKFKAWLVTLVAKNLDVKTLRTIFSKITALLKEKAAETHNKLDDWLVEVLEGILADDAKMDLILTYIQSKISGNICENLADGRGCDEVETLSHMLLTKPGECESALDLGSFLITLLQTILPILIEWYKNKETAE